MAISFDNIPVDLRVPGAAIEIVNTGALRGLPGIPTKILVIGQRLATGTVAADTPIRVLNVAAAEEYFGRGSQLHRMFRSLKMNNSWTETWAIALDELVAGTQAIGSILFGGAVTAAGTLNLYIGGQRLRVGVAATDSPAAVATNVTAAITAKTDLAVTAAVNGGTPEQIDITARHKGENGTDIDVRFNFYSGETLPVGLTAAVTAMNGGAGNPDVASAITVMADEWYTDIAMPYTDTANLLALETELASRFGPLKMQDGHAYAGAAGTHAALTTLGNGRNSPHLSIMGAKASPTPPDEWAAALCGVCAYHAKIDPARPLQTLQLVGIMPPDIEARFILEERNLLLFDAISTWKVDAGGNVLIERVITTYEKNAGGIDDPSYLDLNTMKTLAYLRYSVQARILNKFPRFKLGDDGTQYGAGQKIVTPKIIRAELIALFRQWEEAGLAENIDQFKEDLIVERDGTDVNRINALIPPDIINQFRVFAGQVEFRL